MKRNYLVISLFIIIFSSCIRNTDHNNPNIDYTPIPAGSSVNTIITTYLRSGDPVADPGYTVVNGTASSQEYAAFSTNSISANTYNTFIQAGKSFSGGLFMDNERIVAVTPSSRNYVD